MKRSREASEVILAAAIANMESLDTLERLTVIVETFADQFDDHSDHAVCLLRSYALEASRIRQVARASAD